MSEELHVVGYTGAFDDVPRFIRDASPVEPPEEMMKAVIEDLRRSKFVYSGNYHQYGHTGIPVLSDGTLFMVSMRTWGKIMYDAVYGDGKGSENQNYCAFAWSVWDGYAKENLPPESLRVELKDVALMLAKSGVTSESSNPDAVDIFNQIIFDIASDAFTLNYSGKIVDEIWYDVLEDVKASSAFPNFNIDDVRLAVGRVLCKKMGLEV